MRFWKTYRLPGAEAYELQARWEHFGDAKGPGDLFVTWDLPDDKPQPSGPQERALTDFIRAVEGGYETAKSANSAWQTAISSKFVYDPDKMFPFASRHMMTD